MSQEIIKAAVGTGVGMVAVSAGLPGGATAAAAVVGASAASLSAATVIVATGGAAAVVLAGKYWGRATKRTERAASTATPGDGVREGVAWIALRRVDESRAAAVKRERAPNGSHNREQDRQCFSDRLTSYRAESAELELRYHPSATTASREG